MGLPGVRARAADLRPRRGAGLAAPRQLPVPDLRARARPPGGMPGPRRAPGSPGLGRAAWRASRMLVRAPRGRRAQGVRRDWAPAELLRTSWDETWHLMERAVAARVRASKRRGAATRIGVDEKAAGRGQDYMTRGERPGREHGRAHRRRPHVRAAWTATTTSSSTEQLAGIEAVAMDMWEPYVQRDAARMSPDAGGQDRLRPLPRHGLPRQGGRHRAQAGEPRPRRPGRQSLAGSKYLWLYAAENLPDKHRGRFAALRQSDLKTGRAWAIKESMRHFWEYRRKGWAQRHWKSWYVWAIADSCLEPSDRGGPHAQTPRGRSTELLRPSHHQRRRRRPQRTHPGNPGLHARGYRNREHFKTAIFFHCGGLNLYPRTHSIPG